MWSFLLPFLQPLFSQLLARFCPQPASGQRKDPQVELVAHLVSPTVRAFKPESLANARPTTLRGIKMNNRELKQRHGRNFRKHPNYVEVPKRGPELDSLLDDATTYFWLHVLDAPANHVASGFKSGCKADLPPEK